MKGNSKRKEKTQEIFEKVVEGVQDIIDSGEYEKFLKFRNKFRNYSFNNIVMIYWQFPNATMVAGRKKWQEMNREVITGQKPIQIIAPIPRVGSRKVIKIVDGEEKEVEEQYKFNWYTNAYIFDISQTEGEDFPMESKHIEGDEMSSFFERLKGFSKWPIYEEEIEGSAKGYYSENTEKIVLKHTLSINEKTSVLLHELSHALYDDFDYKTDRNLSEVFVESIAYIVADYFGLDTSLCSFKYITGWAHGDSKKVIELGNKIQKCANKFIDELEQFEMQEVKVAA